MNSGRERQTELPTKVSKRRFKCHKKLEELVTELNEEYGLIVGEILVTKKGQSSGCKITYELLYLLKSSNFEKPNSRDI